jgi:sugar-phosphatase
VRFSQAIECRAVLFDLDGVLIDSEAAVERAWRGWSARHGLRFSDVIAQAHGRRTIETIARVAPHLDAQAETIALEDEEVGRAEEIGALPGAKRFLEALLDGPWAIVTSGSRLLAGARMRACEFPIPPIMITAEDVVEGKPHPSGYERAADLLGVPPADCVVFEDAPPGIEAARAAGARVIGVATTHSPAELSMAGAFVDTLQDVLVEVGPAGTLVLRPA